MTGQLAQFERQADWIGRESLRLFARRQTVAVRRALGELHQRSIQLKREYNQFLDRNEIVSTENL